VRLFVDLDTKTIVASAAERAARSSLSFKRGDSSVIDVYFLQEGVVQELGDGSETGKLGLKELEDYGGDYIVSALSWTKVGTGADTYYRFQPSFNTVELNELLINGTVSQYVADQAARYALTGLSAGTIVGQEDNTTFWKVKTGSNLDSSAGWEPAPQLDDVSLMLEIEWIVAGAISSIGTVTATVPNDVIKGAEGIPTEGTPPYPTPDELEAQFTALRNRLAYSVSAAGNTDLSKASPYEIQSTHRVTAGVGAGAYTRTLSLTTTAAANGDKARIVVLMPESENPTLEVRNSTSAGALLFTLSGTGAEFSLPLSFTFNGTAWESDQ
jgi:hypothetical protein